jgi:2'-5' RNA ligase
MENKIIRSFFAIPLSDTCRLEINQSVKKLINEMPPVIKWVDIKNIHITLKFLGEFNSNDITPIKNKLATSLSTVNQFDLIFQNLGVFPSVQEPKVIWIGISSPVQLVQLFEGVEKAALSLGYPKEVRGFSPHITVGRVKKGVDVQDLFQIVKLIQNRKVNEVCKTRIDKISLFQSKLMPAGPVYSELFSIILKQ